MAHAAVVSASHDRNCASHETASGLAGRLREILGAALAWSSLQSASAQQEFITSAGGYSAATDYGAADNSLRDGFTGVGPYAGTVGFTFTVGASNVLVTNLGYYDGPNSAAADVPGYVADGLNNAHEVGIFDSTGNVVASATVAAGTVDIAIADFRYAALPAPVTLLAGATYTLGGQVTQLDLTTSGDLFRDDNGGFTFASAFTVSGADVSNADIADFTNVSYSGPPSNPTYAGGNFSEPNEAGTGYAGANFIFVQAPEPSTYAMMLIGLSAVGFCLRRKLA